MSVVKLSIEKDYGFVILVVIFSIFINFWAGIKVGKARKLYDVQYPQMYAEKSDKNFKAFNCVQRAHQNLLEQLPTFYALLFASAIFRPKVAAIAGLVRLVGCICYVQGYASGDPQKRMRGAFGYLGFLTSIGLAIEAAVKLLSA